MIKALIIDDEKLARGLIQAYLQPHAGIQVVAECANGFEGVKAIQEHRPDLIFLDVQMPKLSGFEMLELLDETPVIIFSTAYDQYAIKAFELSAADYLLKPFVEKRFNEALEKALLKIGKQTDRAKVADKLVGESREWKEKIDRLVVRLGTKIVIVPIEKVTCIEAEDDYVNIHSDGKKYLKQMTMKYLDEVLPKGQFVRVHRSFILNIGQIDRLEAYSKDAYVAILKNGFKASVSRAGYTALREVLKF